MGAPLDGSIKSKLLRIVVMTTLSSLMLGVAGFIVYDRANFMQNMRSNTETLAKVVAINSEAALAFSSREDAQGTLAALSAEQHIASACIFDFDKSVFATYSRDGLSASVKCPVVKSAGSEFGADELSVFQRIPPDGNSEHLGTLYIESDLTALNARWKTYGTILLCVLGFALIMSFVISIFLQGQIVNPLSDLVQGAERVAEGDLSSEVLVSSRDEIGVLGRAFNGMAARLSGLVSEVGENIRAVTSVSQILQGTSEQMIDEVSKQEEAIVETSQSVTKFTDSIAEVNQYVGNLAEAAMETSSSIREMDTSIDTIASHMDNLAEAIDTTSSSVVEMSANIGEVAQNVETLEVATEITESSLRELNSSVQQVEGNASRSHELSENASMQAETGMDAVREMIEGMQEIELSFTSINDVVSGLAEKSESIGEIIKVIDEVANQTDLLSLNAAIIASQAGEHGRAFAVVAEQVKSLAERTAQSTRKISDLIISVQGEVSNAVGAMGVGRERVKKGVVLSDAAGEVLKGIIDSSHQSTQMVSEIVQATGEQVKDIAQVENAVGQVKAMVREINRSTHEQENASREITKLVEQIRGLGQEVKRSTYEQSKGSKLITNAMEDVTTMIDQIVSTSESSMRTEELKSMVGTLFSRSQQLEREIGRFNLGVEEVEEDPALVLARAMGSGEGDSDGA
ncbi:MAG: HAMP domain-containing protein [Deltaproteobacteria bacterium]|nr:HAMP domain-containing protein [Deltaproteobacteria bacterium]